MQSHHLRLMTCAWSKMCVWVNKQNVCLGELRKPHESSERNFLPPNWSISLSQAYAVKLRNTTAPHSAPSVVLPCILSYSIDPHFCVLLLIKHKWSDMLCNKVLWRELQWKKLNCSPSLVVTSVLLTLSHVSKTAKRTKMYI